MHASLSRHKCNVLNRTYWSQFSYSSVRYSLHGFVASGSIAGNRHAKSFSTGGTPSFSYGFFIHRIFGTKRWIQPALGQYFFCKSDVWTKDFGKRMWHLGFWCVEVNKSNVTHDAPRESCILIDVYSSWFFAVVSFGRHRIMFGYVTIRHKNRAFHTLSAAPTCQTGTFFFYKENNEGLTKTWENPLQNPFGNSSKATTFSFCKFTSLYSEIFELYRVSQRKEKDTFSNSKACFFETRFFEIYVHYSKQMSSWNLAVGFSVC